MTMTITEEIHVKASPEKTFAENHIRGCDYIGDPFINAGNEGFPSDIPRA